ncbi:glycosyltransferase family 2 protein [Psychroflexus sediminis]|uniref:Glycosyltransferase involved in cell wall bisynthesis n=1 Tax=Psychroflexus sediminis TaxID=470826 RepID=A0A1G7VCR7_9FLAO|nr:glycosyltransferase [Psychroflexus sediminis]SDG57635.1 Glycosyltransferase involved in cell wall bisynthesis [Psychroflexus sediminis]
MNLFFSVVIPLYNKENYILNTLNSVLQQDFIDFEIIIVNDGSTDESANKLKSITDSRLKIITQENLGVPLARNKGISEANGMYIALLDADDYWYPHHLRSLKELIELFPSAGLYGDRYEIRLQNKTTRLARIPGYAKNEPLLIQDYFAESLADPILWTSASAFKKEVFYEIGKFDPDLRTAQDLDFFIRGALKFPVAFHPRVGMRYNKDSENNLAKSKFNRDRLRFISKYKAEEEENTSLKKYLDINRYALVIRCKLEGDPIWKKVISEIEFDHLTSKQQFLLSFPASMLSVFKKIQIFFITRGIYLTAFR